MLVFLKSLKILLLLPQFAFGIRRGPVLPLKAEGRGEALCVVHLLCGFVPTTVLCQRTVSPYVLWGQDSVSSPPAYKEPGLSGGGRGSGGVEMNLLTGYRELRWDEGTVWRK